MFSRQLSIRFFPMLCAIGLLCAGIAAADTTDALVSWAEKTTPIAWQLGSLTAVSTAVADHFGSKPYSGWTKRGENGLGYPGLGLPTAGVGSSWVYDAVHGIAAGTMYNDDGGWDDQISYNAAPPSKLPSRDLSGVVSAHGLKLGMTTAQAVAAFRVSPSAVHKLDARTAALALLNKCPKPQPCSNYGVVIFRDGHAVYIMLGWFPGNDG
jgi:hypothetical protein